MHTVADLATARRRRQSTAGDVDPSAAGGDLLRITMDRAYARVRPPAAAADSMPDDLRRWLRSWAHAHAWDHAQLEVFIDGHAGGVAATLEGAQHDPDVQHLLAPELLLALLALDVDPYSLRARWPETHDVREVLALADLFGCPFSG